MYFYLFRLCHFAAPLLSSYQSLIINNFNGYQKFSTFSSIQLAASRHLFRALPPSACDAETKGVRYENGIINRIRVQCQQRVCYIEQIQQDMTMYYDPQSMRNDDSYHTNFFCPTSNCDHWSEFTKLRLLKPMHHNNKLKQTNQNYIRTNSIGARLHKSAPSSGKMYIVCVCVPFILFIQGVRHVRPKRLDCSQPACAILVEQMEVSCMH